MPPKIKGMTAKLAPHTSSSQRFTLMVSGEDTVDTGLERDTPPSGLPQERFLVGDRLPIAPILLLGQSDLGVNPNEVIACLQPVHLHATRDHLILMAQSQIDLTAHESANLLQAALPFIEEDFRNKVLFQGQRDWFISAGPFTSLATHSIDQAHGRNIDWWMPRDTNVTGVAKLWRKLQNEIQMLWHIDPVNQEREQRGYPSINSLWISGIGKLADIQTPPLLENVNQIYGNHPLLAGLAKYLAIPQQHEIDFSNLQNTFAWIDHPESIWDNLRVALLGNELDEIEVIDFPKGQTRHRIFTPKDFNKKSWAFWKKSEPLTWQEIISA
ncbi:hypothetical protein [Polynucleobacter sp. AP-Sving-400A-A2]|uniref:hypothetical protein n=1 Tax=Polynucleobacter sp. AP-Sving-400A-A2 TaxID=2081049 RepID=UPI001BFDD4FE|nr:hypothetical protein [Polynucleobacter sp. AP-Sving-400A-A2]QWE13974.1 hypothetical protein C2758_07285 [Polynucleobacter sp. AP-Sving-400A-A2]